MKTAQEYAELASGNVQCTYQPNEKLKCIQRLGHGGLGHMVSDLKTALRAENLIRRSVS